MSATIRDGNTWTHPDFDVWIDENNIIVIDAETDCLPLTVADARDLMQALAQAIAAAELIAVESGA